jgi:hypothetical protein
MLNLYLNRVFVVVSLILFGVLVRNYPVGFISVKYSMGSAVKSV